MDWYSEVHAQCIFFFYNCTCGLCVLRDSIKMGGVKEKFGTKHILEKRKIQFEGEKILKKFSGAAPIPTYQGYLYSMKSNIFQARILSKLALSNCVALYKGISVSHSFHFIHSLVDGHAMSECVHFVAMNSLFKILIGV